MQEVIELNQINKFYGNIVRQQVLYDLDLSFESNTFNSIIGQSGSGKSTLLNIMGTLDKPTSGEVYLNGRRTDALKMKEIARVRNQDIGFIFQFHYLIPEYNIIDNVLMPYKIFHGKVPQPVKERAYELLDAVGLSEVAKNNATAVSGGQAQRAAIARALINEPKIILADEPTGNLDTKSTEVVYRLLRDLNEQYGTTFVVITHDMNVAEQTDRIVELEDGRIKRDFLT